MVTPDRKLAQTTAGSATPRLGSAAEVVVSAELSDQLPDALLRSTARTTMSQPMRDGERFRQASMDGIERTALPTNVPTVEETSESNAFTWVIVLLVVGTIVPMATWWVFSR